MRRYDSSSSQVIDSPKENENESDEIVEEMPAVYLEEDLGDGLKEENELN